jgi:hypothetical protein
VAVRLTADPGRHLPGLGVVHDRRLDRAVALSDPRPSGRGDAARVVPHRCEARVVALVAAAVRLLRDAGRPARRCAEGHHGRVVPDHRVHRRALGADVDHGVARRGQRAGAAPAPLRARAAGPDGSRARGRERPAQRRRRAARHPGRHLRLPADGAVRGRRRDGAAAADLPQPARRAHKRLLPGGGVGAGDRAQRAADAAGARPRPVGRRVAGGDHAGWSAGWSR